jgi:hypothetical protein
MHASEILLSLDLSLDNLRKDYDPEFQYELEQKIIADIEENDYQGFKEALAEYGIEGFRKIMNFYSDFGRRNTRAFIMSNNYEILKEIMNPLGGGGDTKLFKEIMGYLSPQERTAAIIANPEVIYEANKMESLNTLKEIMYCLPKETQEEEWGKIKKELIEKLSPEEQHLMQLFKEENEITKETRDSTIKQAEESYRHLYPGSPEEEIRVAVQKETDVTRELSALMHAQTLKHAADRVRADYSKFEKAKRWIADTFMSAYENLLALGKGIAKGSFKELGSEARKDRGAKRLAKKTFEEREVIKDIEKQKDSEAGASRSME